MPPRSHLVFNNPSLGTEAFRYRPRKPGDVEDEEQQPDYSYLSSEYAVSLRDFNRDRDRRIQERNLNLNVPANLFHLDIEFFGWFDSKSFESYYRRTYGLSAAKHYKYNTRVIFSIADQTRFEEFIAQIEAFIAATDHTHPTYDTRLKYIKSFRFLTSEIILEDYSDDRLSVFLNLVDSVDLFQNVINPIEQSLITFLTGRGIEFSIENLNRTIELQNSDPGLVREIVRNYDIIHSVNSTSFGVIRPSLLGLARREYPFNIEELSAESLIIGVIDTGVSTQTPLSTIVVNNNSDFGIGGLDPRIDVADHGTGVAALAALGPRLALPIAGTLTADARILSIRLLDGSRGSVTTAEVERLIRKAKTDFGVRIFVLTINFSQPLRNDAAISNYAVLLDKLSFELDILISIATANNNPDAGLTNIDVANYPNWFVNEISNICPPADSMNNLTIGAIGSNFETERNEAITIASQPAIYTRKYHLLNESLFQKNRHLFKPDTVYGGGNYENDAIAPLPDAGSALQILSTDLRHHFMRRVGTSYSAPLISNLAVRILNKYPTLRLQTVKALIINSAQKITFTDQFSAFTEAQKRSVVGNGQPDLDKCLNSNDNEVTLVIEDSITPGNIKSFELALPEYLNDLYKNLGLLEVTATLCFKFNPVLNNHLAYCPIHIGFGFFKNVPIRGGENFLNNNADIAIKNGLGWSQDAFYKSKIYSNSQKVRFVLSRSELVDGNNRFKIAINSKVHPILPTPLATSLLHEYEFSLVIRITEQLPAARQTNQLYSELRLINSLEAINEIDVELENEI
jgi:hypothetical protein